MALYFEPQFSWKNTTVDMNILPVVIRSPDWYTLILKPSIRRIRTKEGPINENTRIGRTVTDEAK